jgi:hypothetical protein
MHACRASSDISWACCHACWITQWMQRLKMQRKQTFINHSPIQYGNIHQNRYMLIIILQPNNNIFSLLYFLFMRNSRYFLCTICQNYKILRRPLAAPTADCLTKAVYKSGNYLIGTRHVGKRVWPVFEGPVQLSLRYADSVPRRPTWRTVWSFNTVQAQGLNHRRVLGVRRWKIAFLEYIGATNLWY